MQLVRFKSSRYVGYLDPRFDSADLRTLLESPEEVGEFEGAERIPTRPGREVHRISIETPRGRIEVYTHLLINRRLAETFRNPQAYSVLWTGRRMLANGVPTSRVLGAVRRTWNPFNRTSFAVTLAIPDAVPLSMLAADEFVGKLGGFNKLTLIRQIATQTAWMHAHGFFHKDLIAQNILVAHRGSTPMVWFVGLGRAGFAGWLPPYWLQRRWALDLLALMQSDIQAINERDRAVFLETYLRALGSHRGAEIVRSVLTNRLNKGAT